MSNINTAKLSVPSKIQSGSYKKSTKCFFFQSKLLEAQVTELFDDLWPTVTAIKNLRWQVNGYYHEMNVKQNEILSRRFVDKEDKTNRPNLYRACIDQSWEQQEYRICKNLLTNIFALYEGWIEMILPILRIQMDKSTALQFPDKVRSALLLIQQTPNAVLVDAFYDVYVAKNSNSSLAHLENYLKVYRYFKECRNSIIHRGGKSDQRTVDSFNDTIGLTNDDLDVNEIPEMFEVSSAGNPVRISLRGVVGFSQIVLKLVEVLDAEFIKAERAVDCFVAQVKEFTPFSYTISPDVNRAENRINGILKSAGFLPHNYSEAFVQLLRDKSIIAL